MSSISMEWLGGPIVLNLNEEELLLDLDEGYLPTPDEPSPDAPASLGAPRAPAKQGVSAPGNTGDEVAA